MDTSRMTWRKSSYSGSNGNCVEVGLWQKASYSGSSGSCVEVSAAPRIVAVRDSKDPGGPKLSFAPEQWRAFTDRIKAGVFDPA